MYSMGSRRPGGQLQRQPRLSDPAGTGDRDHPLRSHEIGEGGEFVPTPDERHRRSRETARQAKDYDKADQLRTELVTHHLEIDDTPHGPRWRRTVI